MVAGVIACMLVLQALLGFEESELMCCLPTHGR